MLWWSGRLLVLAALLTTAAAAALDTQEIQKEEEQIVFVNAGQGPPENVTVTPVGTNALNVSWDPPEEPPAYYIVRIYSNSIEYDTSNTYFLVEGLEPCQYYDITVLSRYSDHQYVAKASGTTNTPEAPSPQSCWFSDVHTSTLDVNWKDTEFKCGIVGHRIRWSWDVLWSDEESTNQTTTTTETQVHLDNFRPYTNVTASVEAESSAGYGQPTTCWNVTDQDIPGRPVIQDVTASVGSADVTWTPPEDANGIITEYMINAVSGEDSVSTSVDGTVLTAVVDLKDCQTYNITVQASTEAGWGPVSEAWTITTSDPNPPPPELCWFSNITHSKMVINWLDPVTQCGLINNHSISWSWDVLWADEQGSNVTFSQDTSITLTDLQPYTNVTAQVAAVTEGGVGPPTSCWNVTSPDRM